MPPITLAVIETKQTELATMIQQFRQQTGEAREIEIEDRTIELAAGEHYAGAVLDADGEHLHHLVLMAHKPASKLNWDAAVRWAASVDGVLPTRQEQALLYANCKPHLQPEWHWSSEQHKTEASYAWLCDFLTGDQLINLKSWEGSAVAVRRVD